MLKTWLQSLAAGSLFLAGNAFANKVDFSKDLMPLFEERCIKCHGHVKESGKLVTKGDLDLTKPESIKETFKAGNPKDSSLYNLVITDDEDDFMPPKGDRLSDAQKKLIHDWIQQGGSFEGYSKKAKGETLLQKMAKGVKNADQSIISHFEQHGALVLPLAQKTPLLQVNFKPVASKTDSKTVTRLAELKDQLVWLNLSRSSIDDTALKTVGKLNKLTRLHLDNTNVSDAGIKNLGSLTNLEYINLYNTKVTDAGLSTLKGLKSLKKIFLWQSKVTEAGVADLQKALPDTYIHAFTPKMKVEKKAAEKPKKKK